MDNKEPQNCWEFKNCPEETRKICPAFSSQGRKCWLVALSLEGTGCLKKKGEGMKFCVKECSWFKKLNPSANQQTKHYN